MILSAFCYFVHLKFSLINDKHFFIKLNFNISKTLSINFTQNPTVLIILTIKFLF